MIQVTEDFVKRTLRDFDHMTEQVDAEVLRETRRIRNKEVSPERNAFIEAASMPGRSMDGMPGGKSWTMDLQNVFDRYEDIDREYVNSTLMHLRLLTEKKEAMNRIMICFLALPEDRDKEVVKRVDILADSIKAGFIECKENLGLEETSAKRLRRRGIQKILQLYRSPYSNQQLMEKGAGHRALMC